MCCSTSRKLLTPKVSVSSRSVDEKSLLLLSEFQPAVGSTLDLVSGPLTSLYLFWIAASQGSLFATNVSSFNNASMCVCVIQFKLINLHFSFL